MHRNEIPDEWCNLGLQEKKVRHLMRDGVSKKNICMQLDLTALQVDAYVRSINKKISLCMSARRKGFCKK